MKIQSQILASQSRFCNEVHWNFSPVGLFILYFALTDIFEITERDAARVIFGPIRGRTASKCLSDMH